MQDATHDTLDALRRGDLAGARTLRLPAAGLTVLPPEIFGLADTLEVLDLSGNALTALPDDLGRLTRLQVLFCSGNPFATLPPVLGDCRALSQVGFRGCGLAEVPGEALPPRLRWLTLTDNRIAHLPDALGHRPRLRKLMLSGNRLRSLPDSLAGCDDLELIRLAANRLDALPAWLPALPALAWTSWAGNAFEGDAPRASAALVPFADLDAGALLGEGTSGRVHRALWRPGGTAPPRPVALKLFKGTMTSDGLPEREMEACLAAGAHPNLTGALGRITGHPDGTDGLLMPLLPPDRRVLAGPPSLASCSRDVYDPALRLAPAALLRLVRGLAAGLAHLHARGLLHGDVYGHNILWDAATGEAVLSDFGAASVLPDGPPGVALQRVEVRAFGLLIGEVLDRAPADFPEAAALRDLERACVQAEVGARPAMAEVVRAVG
ncbi:leucine-rich repeat-containing protein kinase family protein [Methylobacterium sp. HMF5984]|uniref:leucine-rich repeat-containing protein kinase family protein n=1 Tax=unclassified Methylobacterium TaxID=2615210 RepID=UPI001FB8BCAA|nr:MULTISPECIES: leucine-rich repeat-containing protein kinase family protein [unclassified Methylobacterium]MCJ2008411.1 leucine-rich repeat-containing serine/threonine-protein kinase [Methylobacterium sp. J-092]MCJ2075833.1 leucine-rich repeat-containing serine/threonine-protein kinase [Methylobacterium sp. E-016]